jgi:hypothetical protein
MFTSLPEKFQRVTIPELPSPGPLNFLKFNPQFKWSPFEQQDDAPPVMFVGL